MKICNIILFTLMLCMFMYEFIAATCQHPKYLAKEQLGLYLRKAGGRLLVSFSINKNHIPHMYNNISVGFVCDIFEV
jgi:hypothetical protein